MMTGVDGVIEKKELVKSWFYVVDIGKQIMELTNRIRVIGVSHYERTLQHSFDLNYECFPILPTLLLSNQR